MNTCSPLHTRSSSAGDRKFRSKAVDGMWARLDNSIHTTIMIGIHKACIDKIEQACVRNRPKTKYIGRSGAKSRLNPHAWSPSGDHKHHQIKAISKPWTRSPLKGLEEDEGGGRSRWKEKESLQPSGREREPGG